MKTILLGLGWIFAALAVVGVVLPVIPATPFVLLSAACFARSSPAAMQWLASNRWLGPVYRDWQRHGGIRPLTKALMLLAAAMTPFFTLAVYPAFSVWLVVSILGAAIAGAAILLVPTIRQSR